MWKNTYIWLFLLFTIASMLLFAVNNNIVRHSLINETIAAKPVAYLHIMHKDPEVNICYSLQSFTMPEEMINLNGIAFGRKPLDPSLAPDQVTFDDVHGILYGNTSEKLIYQYGKKYFNKTLDRSYPYTSLTSSVFRSVIERLSSSLKPQFIVEVGSHTGNSAANIGTVLKKEHPGSFLLCIDTWLGSLHMWVSKGWPGFSVAEDGRPTVFYQFLANIIQQNLTDVILPASMTSITGARFLQTFQFRPQLVYLDSAHDQGETLVEMALYWNTLRPGGIIFGDDWSWISVRCDVKKFMYMRNLTVELLGNTWILKKPLD